MPSRVDAVDEKHVSSGLNRAVKVAINALPSCEYNPESEAAALGDDFVNRTVIVDIDDEPEEDLRELEAYLRTKD